MRLILTRHAETVIAERNIQEAWIERALAEPDSVEPDPSTEGAFRAYRAIEENGRRVLRVVYVPDGDARRIVTVFFDRTRRR